MGVPNLRFADISVVYYHQGCSDGMSGAWAAKTSEATRDDCKYIPYAFGHRPKQRDYAGQNVVFIDACPPRDDLLKVKELAKSVWVLDHHKTGREACSDIPGTYFNYNMSGASIAWRAFHGSKKRPALITYCEDIDLWKLRLPLAREVQTVLYNVPFTFEAYDIIGTDVGFAKLMDSGVQLTEYRNNILEDASRNVMYSSCTVDGVEYDFAVLNIPTFHSSMGDRLRYDSDFAAMWYMKSDGTVKIGLRAAQEKDVDVSLIASALNPKGGGHRCSAGVTVSLKQALTFINGDFNNAN